MATTRAKKQITAEDILTAYVDFALEEDYSRYSVYKFCKSIKLSESDFYNHYSNLETVERHVWAALMNSAIDTVKGDQQYGSLGSYDRLLALHYTLFENFLLNRSFILQSLGHHAGLADRGRLLKDMQRAFQGFIGENFEKLWKSDLIKSKSVTQLRKAGTHQGFWVQLMLLLDYWVKDESAGFEKTDVAIEKSMKVTRDVLDTTPIRSVLDLGKFLFKDKFSNIFDTVVYEDSQEHTHK